MSNEVEIIPQKIYNLLCKILENQLIRQSINIHRGVNGILLNIRYTSLQFVSRKTTDYGQREIELKIWFSSSELEMSKRRIKRKAKEKKNIHNSKRWFNKLLQVIYRDDHEITFRKISFNMLTDDGFFFFSTSWWCLQEPHFRLTSLLVNWVDSRAKMFT